MPDEFGVVQEVASAATWDARVALIRRVPETYGLARHQAVYAAIAERVYVPSLTPDFGYVHWRPEYELAPLSEAYDVAAAATHGFADITADDLAAVIREHPETLRVFRLLVGLSPAELAEATGMVAEAGARAVGKGTIVSTEAGASPKPAVAALCAAVVDAIMAGRLFPPGTGSLRSKVEKPDTRLGWDSVRRFAADGVPLPVFLHQRLYGGGFRQLLDATSGQRGDLLEAPVEELFAASGVPHIRTGSHNQAEIEDRFGLTVRPAPDFVVFDNRGGDRLRALLECKGANDGGTARDKAARFQKLRAEANRLGGVPLFAVLGGIGWRRINDALGPVVRDTDGRVFTIATLSEMLTTEPLPSLTGLVPTP